MSLLPLTVLPYIPTRFESGDRLTYAKKAYVRNESGMWESPGLPAVTEAEVREAYVCPQHLAAFGVPLLCPAPIPADAQLPGRTVVDEEKPFDDRPYLMAGEIGREFTAYRGDGPWGAAQRTCTPGKLDRPAAFDYEMTKTASGRVWFRAYGIPLVYIPADLPTEAEMPPLISAAALRLAFGAGPWR